MLSLIAVLALQDPSLTRTVEAGQAYSEPNGDGIRVERGRPSGPWTSEKDHLVWFVKFREAGKVAVAVDALTDQTGGDLTLTVSDRKGKLLATKASASNRIDFGTFGVRGAGHVRFELARSKAVAASFRVVGLRLTGTNVPGALINDTQWRSTASTHLRWPVAPDQKITWFYNEILPKTDPVATYYMACGWHRGYFGIQVNSKTERRVIFSVWDSGKEAVDRSKVDDELQVKLMGKGPGVFTGSFGNEGTGGHSHLVYPWKTGQVQRFLVRAEPHGTTTTYSGYYYFNDKKTWGLISSWRAPQDGGAMTKLYSFIEDFWGGEGQVQRLAEYGPVWVRNDVGNWTQVLEGAFTHTARGQASYREDYFARVMGRRVAMSSGGYTDDPTTAYNAPFSGVTPSPWPAKDVLDLVAGLETSQK